MTKKTYYITTAIDYVNAEPHVGHAYQKVVADILARWHTLLGEDVFFLTGTDEHGKKIAESAEKAGKSPQQFVNEVSEKFKEAWKALNIKYDRFIRTTDADHIKVVEELTKRCFKSKDIYKGYYEGFYCTPCESYYTEKDLVDGCCPIHKKPIEKLKEETYFFKLSKYQKFLLDLYKKHPEYILPAERRNEITNRVKEGLIDLSITRTSINWGIPFPLDKKHVFYVWWEALINYYSATRRKGKEKYWPANIHLLGKDNGWFHSVIWPAMLKSAGIPLPKTVFIHGFLKFNGEKISKSLGNVISPVTLANKYGTDSVRYFCARQFPFATGEDGDFSEAALIARHNNELADKLGNLVSRVSALAEKYGIKKKSGISIKSNDLIKKVSKHFENYEIDKALNEIFLHIDACNEYVQRKKPWETHDSKVLYELAESIKNAAILLSPFIPETSEKIAKVFNFQISLKSLKAPLKISKIKKAQILFNKIEVSLPKQVSELPVVRKHEGTADVNLRVRGESSKSKSDSIKNNMAKQEKFSKKAGKAVERAIDKAEEVAERAVAKVKEIAKEVEEKIENKKAEKAKKAESTMPEGVSGLMQFKDWEKIDLRVAKIKKAEDIEGADKLYKLTLDVGELGTKVVCAGIKGFYQKEELKGKKLIFFANLTPRMMKGILSEGMILAAVNKEHSKVVLIEPDKDIDAGAKVS